MVSSRRVSLCRQITRREAAKEQSLANPDLFHDLGGELVAPSQNFTIA